jgi:erythritol kinase (D-erythritol 1-phosphate-forming)
MAVVCIDAGTTMIKAVGYDEQGAELVVVRQATTVTRPQPGWAQQDMESVWDAVVYTVRGVLHELQSPVDYVAITAQGDGCWLVDASGGPTGQAILWNDGRAADIVEDWTRSGLLNQAFRINGSVTSSGLPNAILTWLHRYDPERLERSAFSLTCGGWIFAQLTGQLVIDESDASAPFMDIRARRYSSELLRLYEMEWAQPLLPDIRGDDRRTAELTSAAAAQLGLPAGTPIVLSSYDIASTAIGVGAVSSGQSCSILGTTLCTEVVTEQVNLGDTAAGLTVALGLPGKYLRAFPTFAGGEVIQWACQLLGLDDPFVLGDLATRARPGAGGLVFLPYLAPAGERAPFLNTLARGAFLGMSFEHRREHIARAVLEGLTLVIQDCLIASRSKPTELRVCGGGAASPVWLQLIADVSGIPVLRSIDSEVGAKGAFLLGMVATGRAARAEDIAPEYVRTRDTFQPDPARTTLYADLYADFLAVRETTGAAWPRLAAMRNRAADIAATGPLPVVSARTLERGSAELTERGGTPTSTRRPGRSRS